VSTHVKMLVVVALAAIVGASHAAAQDKPPAPLPAPKPALVIIPINVQVVISKFQGDKKVGSLSHSLAVTVDGGPSRLRMGAKVPVRQMQGGVSYQDVGTNIDCNATTLDGGRFRIMLTVEDTSIYGDERAELAKATDNPTFRSFHLSTSAVLRDGQSAQFTAATDKVNGEVTKVDVTLTVLK